MSEDAIAAVSSSAEEVTVTVSPAKMSPDTTRACDTRTQRISRMISSLHSREATRRTTATTKQWIQDQVEALDAEKKAAEVEKRKAQRNTNRALGLACLLLVFLLLSVAGNAVVTAYLLSWMEQTQLEKNAVLTVKTATGTGGEPVKVASTAFDTVNGTLVAPGAAPMDTHPVKVGLAEEHFPLLVAPVLPSSYLEKIQSITVTVDDRFGVSRRITSHIAAVQSINATWIVFEFHAGRLEIKNGEAYLVCASRARAANTLHVNRRH